MNMVPLSFRRPRSMPFADQSAHLCAEIPGSFAIMGGMSRDEASRTAVLVCQGRAVAHDRIAVGRFADPIARSLLREDELAGVERARTGEAPQGWGHRVEFEMLAATVEVIVPRTIAIDDAVRAGADPQLVILGAGLDDRAWRMPELAGVDVFAVDHPASQADKRDRAEALQPVSRSLRYVPVDFGRDALGPALAAAGHDESLTTTWLWEGVVPYLTPAEVETTATALAARSAAGSRLVVNYQAPSRLAAVGRLFARALASLSRRPDPFATEPRRSAWTPDSLRALLSGVGLRVTSDDGLLTLSERLGLPVRHQQSVRSGRVAVAVTAR
jgi:methyltransferase (TIGR00027 family)